MASFIKLNAVLPADTQQPKLTDILRDIIDPNKLAYYDRDDAGAARSINGAPLRNGPASSGTKTWTSASGIGYDGLGNIVCTSSTRRIGYINQASTDAQAVATVALVASGSATYAGPVIRRQDDANYLFAWIQSDGAFRLQRRAAGVTTTIAQATVYPEVDREYQIFVEAAGNVVTARMRGKLSAGASDELIELSGADASPNPAGIGTGIIFSAPGQVITGFYSR